LNAVESLREITRTLMHITSHFGDDFRILDLRLSRSLINSGCCESISRARALFERENRGEMKLTRTRMLQRKIDENKKENKERMRVIVKREGRIVKSDTEMRKHF